MMSAPVNVLHISPSSELGGSRNSLVTLVQSLDRSRYNPVVALPGHGALTTVLDEIGVSWTNICIEPFRKGKYWPQLPYEIKTIRQAIAEYHIGLIHCNEHFVVPHALSALYDGSILGGLFAYLRGDRYEMPLTLPVVSHMRLFVRSRHVINYRLRHVQKIIAVSKNAKKDFASFPWCDDKVCAIHNAVTLEPFRKAVLQRKTMRAKLGVSDEDFLLGTIGVFSPRKRTQVILEAFDVALRTNPHLKLLVIGEARHHQEEYYRRMVQYIAERKLESSVIMLPWQDNPAVYLAALDVNVLVSSEEGFSRIIIEAGACGVPTIASNIAPNREAIVNNDSGWLIGLDDSSDDKAVQDYYVSVLAEKIVALSRNPQEVLCMGERALALVEAQFSASVHAGRVMDVFDEAMAAYRESRMSL